MKIRLITSWFPVLVAALVHAAGAQVSNDPGSLNGNVWSGSGAGISPLGIYSGDLPGSTEPMIVDRSVDSTQYRVGTNDEFTIHLWGTNDQVFRCRINGEGFIVIPQVGLIGVKGLTLAEARAAIRARLQKEFRMGEIAIILSRLKTFKVYVAGEVMRPGGYLASGMDRVSDIIERAGGVHDQKPRRGIQLIADSGSIRHADLARFAHSKNITENPYLREGEKVFVPPQHDWVMVNGFVEYPGKYDFVDGDCLGDLIQSAGGFSRGADLARILVSRFLNDGDSLQTLQLGAGDSAFPLQKDDRVLASGLPDYRIPNQAIISGEVRFPGIYPIQMDKTRLSSLIDAAGGLTSAADLEGSRVYRGEMAGIDDKEFERLGKTAALPKAPSEWSYFKSQFIEDPRRLSLNLGDLQSERNNIILRGGDSVHIERRSLAIRVSGAVRQPGLIPFVEGASSSYYIKQAGGPTENGSVGGARIIQNGKSAFLKIGAVKNLRPGDMVWVPEQPYKNPLEHVKDILMIASSLVTIIWMTLSIQGAI